MESKCFFRDLFLSLASECKNGEEIESGLCINELISFAHKTRDITQPLQGRYGFMMFYSRDTSNHVERYCFG